LLQKWWPAADLTTEDLHEVADLCVGYVAADLVALVRQASLAHMMKTDNSETRVRAPTTNTSCKDYLLRAMEQVGASALRDAAMTAPLTTTGWDDIAGEAGGAKKALRQAIEWPRTKREAFVLLGLTPPRGILLHGPPGCAKTSLARAAAGAAGVAFVSLAPADVYASSYVGDAEAIVRRSFDLARSAAPCVLFFDEIDAILGVMSDDGNDSAGGLARGHSAEARVLSTFLNEMDGVDGSWKDGVLVLGATNRPWTLDAALMRPGRFDKIIYVPPPDREGRRAIFEMQTRNWRANRTTKNDDPIDIDYLAIDEISGNMTGAEIKGACQEAAMHALREYTEGEISEPVVRQKNLLHALSLVKPLLSDPSQMESFRLFESKRRNCT
jgi:SpoVK/Ycf46/Vps4 family AAA+-type ATPase